MDALHAVGGGGDGADRDDDNNGEHGEVLFGGDASDEESAKKNCHNRDAGTEVALGDYDEEKREAGDDDEREPELAKLANGSLFFFAGKKVGEINHEGKF